MKYLQMLLCVSVLLAASQGSAAWLVVNVKAPFAIGERPKQDTQEKVDIAFPRRGDIMKVRANAWADVVNNWGTYIMTTPDDGGRLVRFFISDNSFANTKFLRKMHRTGEVIHAPHRYRVLYSDIPAPWRATLSSTGQISKTWAELKGYIYDKETGTTIP